MHELAGGDVHRDRELGGRLAGPAPRRQLATGLLEDPRSDGDDQPAVLEQGDEVVGLDLAPKRVLPAEQGFHADHVTVGGGDEGLVPQPELTEAEGGSQPLHELVVAGAGRPGRAVDEHVAARSLGLGPLEGELGVTQQDRRRITAAVVDRHPDADAQPDLLGAEAEGAHEALADPLRNLFGVAGVVDVGAQHCELVSCQPYEKVLGAEHGVEALGQRGEHLVAPPVAVAGVHEAEAVDVEHEHGDVAGAPGLERGLQPLLEDDPVRKAGEGVAVHPAGHGLAGVQLAPAAVAEQDEGEGHEGDEEEGLLHACAVGVVAGEPADEVEADDDEEDGGAAGGQAPQVSDDLPPSFIPSGHVPSQPRHPQRAVYATCPVWGESGGCALPAPWPAVAILRVHFGLVALGGRQIGPSGLSRDIARPPIVR